MKIKNLFLAVLALLAFNACTYVPEPPYKFPTNGGTGGTETEEGVYISETFATGFGVFSPVETVGDTPWIIDYKTAKATSYIDGTNKEATSWLISDPVDFKDETEAFVTFDYIIRYAESGKVAANHQLLVSSNYSGDAAAATWTDIPYGAKEGADWVTFAKANVAVPAEFMGKSGVVFALRYTAKSKAGTWEVKNFKVKHGKPEEGEEEKPEEAVEYTVSEALAAFTGAAKPAIVKGYIVGTINGQVYEEGCIFSGTATAATNLLIADAPEETDHSKCMPVQLPSGAVRSALNLVDNPGNYKKLVTLTGSLEKYFGVAGLKTVSKYVIDGVTPEQPEQPETPEVPETPVVPEGDSLIANPGFETWNEGVPAEWGGPLGHNATIAQSTDARTGNYSVVVSGNSESNKRFTSKSYVLAAGTYTFSVYVKANGADKGYCRLGFVPVVDGKVGTYTYESAQASAVTDEWTARVYEFTLAEETEIALIVMNNKLGKGASFLVDDAQLVTADGGNAGGGDSGEGEEGGEEQPETPVAGKTFTAVTSITDGKYIIAAGTNMAIALDAAKTYGYLPVSAVSPENGTVTAGEENAYTIEAVEGGYTIKDSLGRYLYMTGTFNSVNLDTALPSEGAVWTIEFNADGTAKITNTYNDKFMQYSSQFTSYGIYPDERGDLPTLYKMN